MRVGILHGDLMITGAQSLKEKRRVLRSLKDRLAARFNVSVSEVGSQDLWQRAELGVACVSLDAQGASALLQSVEQFIRSHPGASVIRIERMVVDPEEEGEVPDPDEMWD